MLKIKFFSEFKNNAPFLVILGDKEGMHAAHNFFAQQKSAYLSNPVLMESVQIPSLSNSDLYLNESECKEIASHFKNLSEADQPCHAYFETEALGDEVEVLISYGEYEELF